MEHKENKVDPEGKIHQCQTAEAYNTCPSCKIWGILGGKEFHTSTLTRLIVRDVHFDKDSISAEMKKNLDLQWTEVKMETAIDRVKGTALHGSLRQVERVPAGAKFKDMEMIYNVYEEEDKNILVKVFEAMELLQQDYLGGMGSRGYGQVEFKGIKIYWNKKENYETGNLNQEPPINQGFDTPEKIVEKFKEIEKKLK